MCVCTPEIKSPHCARCMPSMEEIARQRKASALTILSPLGFVDLEDDEVPGGIWHKGTNLTINVMTVKAGDFVDAIVEAGRERGRGEAQRAMRQACGLE